MPRNRLNWEDSEEVELDDMIDLDDLHIPRLLHDPTRRFEMEVGFVEDLEHRIDERLAYDEQNEHYDDEDIYEDGNNYADE